jgi:hypothetical protein
MAITTTPTTLYALVQESVTNAILDKLKSISLALSRHQVYAYPGRYLSHITLYVPVL